MTDLTALDEAKQTHRLYAIGAAWPICQVCHVSWPCLTARLIADHEALQARSDRYEKALREIVGSLAEDDCWCHDEGMGGAACVPCIARAALGEDKP